MFDSFKFQVKNCMESGIMMFDLEKIFVEWKVKRRKKCMQKVRHDKMALKKEIVFLRVWQMKFNSNP